MPGRVSTMSRRMGWTSMIAGVLAAVIGCPAALAQPVVPDGFEAIAISPQLNKPVGIAFTGDGRMFVAEKGGVIKVIENGVVISTFVDLTAEVNGLEDRGVLGIALDPNFLTNHRVYLLYAIDRIPGEPDEDAQMATYSRLTRYDGSVASNGNVADPATRAVLIGNDASSGIPMCWSSHSIGALRFGADGSLLMASGDSAVFEVPDFGGLTPSCFSGIINFPASQDIGAFRSQMVNSLDGKMLRVDPATGNGLPGNPYWDGSATSIRSRVWCTGLRNPYRFCVRPGTGGSKHPGTLYINDVGWDSYEEVSVSTVGKENFGWPCREGFSTPTAYPGQTLPQWDCQSVGSQANPGPLVPPLIDYSHVNAMLSNPPGYMGNCASACVFHSGINYPSPYRNAFFFGDVIWGWIKIVRVNAANQVLGVYNFATGAEGPVDFVLDPLTSEVCVVSHNSGFIYRIHSLIGPGDVDHDGDTDVDDLIAVILQWGACADPFTCPGDLDGSGEANVDDLIEVILNWG